MGILCDTKRALEISIWYQVGNALVQVLAQKWFSAITYAIWLRSEFRGQHSAWFSSVHLLLFRTQRQMLEAGVIFSDPCARFACDFGVPEDTFVMVLFFWGEGSI